MASNSGVQFSVAPQLNQKLVADVKSRIDKAFKSKNIDIRVGGARLDADLKQVQAKVAAATGDREVKIKAKVDAAQAKLAFAALSAEADAAGTKSGAGFAEKLSGAFSAKRTLISAAVASSLAILPALGAASGIAAGAAIGLGLVGALILANPRIKAAAKTLGTGLEAALNSAGGSSGLTGKIVSGINTLTTRALPNLRIVFAAVFKALAPLVAPTVNALVKLSGWLAGHINPAIASFRNFVNGLKGPLSAVAAQLKNNAWPNISRFLGSMAGNAGTSVRAFGNLLVAISPLLPLLGKVSGFAATLIGRFPQLAIGIGLAGLALGKLSTAIKVWQGITKVAIAVQAAFDAVMDANPIALVILGVVALAAAAVLVIKNWGPISGFFKSLWAHIKSYFADAINWIKAATVDSWHFIYNTSVAVWNSVAGFFSRFWSGVKGTFNASLGWIKNAASGAWHAVFNTTTSVFGAVEGFFTGFFKRLKTGFTNIVHDVKAVWSGISGAVKGPIHALDADVYVPFAKIVNGGLGLFGVSAKLPKTLGFSDGGQVPGGYDFTGKDDVAARLTAGEFVVNAKSTKKNRALLESINKDQAYASGGEVVNSATKWKGHPYVWGGPANPKNGWDCSSFMSYILGSNGVGLPGGFKAPSNQHGPVASAFRTNNALQTKDVAPGDVAVEKNGNHVGMLISHGQKGSNAIQGFAAKGKAYGTVPQVFGTSDYNYYHPPGINNTGLTGQLLDWAKQGAGWLVPGGSQAVSVLSDLAQKALSGVSGLLGKTVGSKSTIPGQMVNGVAKTLLSAGTNKLKSNPNNWTSGAASVGDSDVGSNLLKAVSSGGEASFAASLLSALKLPGTSSNKAFIEKWEAQEGGYGHNNPLNTTQSESGASTFNSVGVKSYTSMAQALQATVTTLNNGHYGSILAALAKGNESLPSLEGVVQNSPWGTHFATGGVVHAPSDYRADAYTVQASDGERILTRSQSDKYGQVPLMTDAERTVIAQNKQIIGLLSDSAQSNRATASGINSVGKVRRAW